MTRRLFVRGSSAVALLGAIALGCTEGDPAPRDQATAGGAAGRVETLGVEGAWEMVEFSSTRNGETTTQNADAEPLALAVYTSSRFVYVWKGARISGGGSYVFDGEVITQTFDYVSDPSLEGSVWTFDMSVDDTTIVFRGPTKVITRSGEDVTASFPQLREVRKRVSER
ncbi:MAG: hypothetical protein KJO11_01760 [Gemmatimonadetes bacterium]|nr:hypothetical protein [Gemmatimonadota bacterium]MBT8404622.1 hypothetical protein [Gemmatimonadota bacterium]NNF38704.1 hypothetical protein [Gemmatimonadota bacterium]NNK63131.1 hypothetical protein [Gemmatimonadota bacterium]